jgi:hypothetical protein
MQSFLDLEKMIAAQQEPRVTAIVVRHDETCQHVHFSGAAYLGIYTNPGGAVGTSNVIRAGIMSAMTMVPFGCTARP